MHDRAGTSYVEAKVVFNRLHFVRASGTTIFCLISNKLLLQGVAMQALKKMMGF